MLFTRKICNVVMLPIMLFIRKSVMTWRETQNGHIAVKWCSNSILPNKLKTCVRYFSLFLKDKCISLLFRTKYIEKKFNLQLFFLLTVSRTFILSRATTRYPPRWNFSFRKNNYMGNRDNARDVAACPDE